MPKVESIPTAEIAIPYKPKLKSFRPPDKIKLIKTDIETITTGIAVDIIPKDKPPIIKVPVPVLVVSANFRVGL